MHKSLLNISTRFHSLTHKIKIMKTFFAAFKSWLPLAAAVTLLCGVIYGTVQQSYRQGANDPQYQMAADAAFAIEKGRDLKSLVPELPVDISKTLAPFLIIYDDKGIPVASSGILDGKIPAPPPGVFDYARTNGEDVLTWQPRADVRQAIVVRKIVGAATGFVLSGRSLLKVEEREQLLVKQIAFGWVFTLASLLILLLLQKKIFQPDLISEKNLVQE